jgi:transposase
MAVVASMLTAIYHMLKDGTMYHDLGCDHFSATPPTSKKSVWLSACQSLALR